MIDTNIIKDFINQMRSANGKWENGVMRVSVELWNEIANTLESVLNGYEQMQAENEKLKLEIEVWHKNMNTLDEVSSEIQNKLKAENAMLQKRLDKVVEDINEIAVNMVKQQQELIEEGSDGLDFHVFCNMCKVRKAKIICGECINTGKCGFLYRGHNEEVEK